jgi:hypothetical protein
MSDNMPIENTKRKPEIQTINSIRVANYSEDTTSAARLTGYISLEGISDRLRLNYEINRQSRSLIITKQSPYLVPTMYTPLLDAFLEMAKIIADREKCKFLAPTIRYYTERVPLRTDKTN